MSDIQRAIEEKICVARTAASPLSLLPTLVKNTALHAMADALKKGTAGILEANQLDLENARKKGMKRAFLDRLMLDENRILQMAEGVREVAELTDPIAAGDFSTRRPNGLEIQRVRVPLGVIGIIYEARPNVTADAAALCIKSGNAVVLRGGTEAIHSNARISAILSQAAYAAGIPEGAIQFIDIPDRRAVTELIRAHGRLDVIIPRGGAALIKHVVEESSVPVIETGVGICHIFVDADADLDMAIDIAVNAKTSRPSVCNAMETLLIHADVAEVFLPRLVERMEKEQVELRGCERVRRLCDMKPATAEDWATEYGDLILSVKIVSDLKEALAHIQLYGSGHSEAIITTNLLAAHRFQREVDAAAVYVNASTRFTDGGEFGFGAEIGISTQKLHARGPMGLSQLTSTKYLIYGEGQIR